MRWKFDPFRPHPLVRGGHAQTVLGTLLRQREYPYRATQHTLALSDGDHIVLHDDRPGAWQPGGRVALLIHGLAGCHASNYMLRIVDKLNALGVRTFRMDMRGCGAAFSKAAFPPHSDRTEDLGAALDTIGQLCPGSPVALVGFSLGGNLVLNTLAQAEHDATGAVDRAMAVCPPTDLMACSARLRRSRLRFYDRFFIRHLLARVRARRRLFPEAPQIELSAKPTSLWEFDNAVTAPLCGFSDAEAYYLATSPAPRLAQIATPTLILAAADDPLVPSESICASPRSAAVELHVAPGGGHLGFVGRRGTDADCRWMDWRVVEFVRDEG